MNAEVPLKRRTVLQMFAVAGAAGLLGWPLLRGQPTGMQAVRRSRVMLGTVVNLTVYGRDGKQAAAAVTATLERMAALESRLSRFRANSEVGRLNRDGMLTGAGDDLLAVLQLAGEVSRASDGAFDPTMLPLLKASRRLGAEAGEIAPEAVAAASRSGSGFSPFTSAAGQEIIAAGRQLVDYRKLRLDGRRISLAEPGMGITLDGIGKGYIVDQGAATLQEHGFAQIYVEAGGDLLVHGGKPGGEPWRIGLQNPRPESRRPLTVLATERLAVATSGDYHQPFSADYRHHHIIDPRTGFSSPELAACTVTAPTAALADALATAALVLGRERGGALLARFPGCAGCFVGKDLSISKTAGFPA